MSYRKIQGNYAYHGQRVGILASAFNGFIVDNLIKGSLDALMRHGVSEDMIEVIQVPGAYELPIVAKKLAMKKRYDGLIALGAIIRGERLILSM